MNRLLHLACCMLGLLLSSPAQAAIPCTTTADCPTDWFCHGDGVCRSGCFYDDQCGPTETCDNGDFALTSTPISPCAAGADAECVGWEVCWDFDNQCYDSQQVGAECLAGVTCTTTADCPSGTTCEADECVLPGCLGSCVQTLCATNTDCPVGEYCYGDGLCRAGCSFDYQCGGPDWCDNGSVVISGGSTGSCPSGLDAECGAWEICWSGDLQCYPGPTVGAACTVGTCAVDTDCPTGSTCEGSYCILAGCQGSCQDGPCQSNAHCDPGDYCYGDGECRPGCFFDSQCGAGELCVNGETTVLTTPPSGACLFGSDSECPSPLDTCWALDSQCYDSQLASIDCYTGVCSGGQTCPAGSVCAAGACILDDCLGDCESIGCASDADCASGETCYPDGECREGCFLDSQCADGEICDNGNYAGATAATTACGFGSDSECSEFDMCWGADLQCRDQQALWSACDLGSCAGGAACPAGALCQADRCVASDCMGDCQTWAPACGPGDTCPTGMQCFSGVCNDVYYQPVPPTQTATPTNRIVGILDFNGDGLDDMLIGTEHYNDAAKYPLYVFISQGDGTFVEDTASYILGPPAGSRAAEATNPVGIVEDFNGDGVDDVVVIDSGNLELGQDPLGGFYGETPFELMSQPNGQWLVTSEIEFNIDITDDIYCWQGCTGTLHAKSATWGDIDNDGDIDLFFESGGGFENPYPHFMINKPGWGPYWDGTNNRRHDEIIVGVWPEYWRYRSHRLADMDGDGYLDLVMGILRRINNNQDGLANKIVYNDGTGRFHLQNVLELPYPGWNGDWAYVTAQHIHDLDGDGDMDILLSHQRGNVDPDPAGEGNTGRYFQILMNQAGTFVDETATRMASQTATLPITTDFGDGQIRSNNNSPNWIYSSDINRDGLEDLVMYLDFPVHAASPLIYLRTAAGGYVAEDPTLFTTEVYAGRNTRPIDLDGDGFDELVSVLWQVGPDGIFGNGDDYGELVSTFVLPH